MLLKEVGTVTMTVEALEHMERLLAKQIKKEKKRIESWDAKDFIFSDTYYINWGNQIVSPAQLLESVDIDDEIDFIFAETLIKKYNL